MNTEYVYFVFYLRTDIPLANQIAQTPIEYRSKDKIEYLNQYAPIYNWMKRELSTIDFIITGLCLIREE